MCVFFVQRRGLISGKGYRMLLGWSGFSADACRLRDSITVRARCLNLSVNGGCRTLLWTWKNSKGTLLYLRWKGRNGRRGDEYEERNGNTNDDREKKIGKAHDVRPMLIGLMPINMERLRIKQILKIIYCHMRLSDNTFIILQRKNPKNTPARWQKAHFCL